MFSAVCLTLTAAMLAFILRYRVHIHIEYQPPAGRTYKRRRHIARRRAADPQEETAATLTDALIGLGATRKDARAAAAHVIAAHPTATIETLLRAAIAETTRKGAAN